MSNTRTPITSMLAAYGLGLVFYLLQQFLLVTVLGQVDHPLSLLASAPDPLRALALWDLGERLLCVLLAGWPVAWLLRRLPAPGTGRLLVTFSAAMVAGTLAGLASYYGPPPVFNLWLRLLDIALILLALPILNSRFLLTRMSTTDAA